jgi:hypothetical protein
MPSGLGLGGGSVSIGTERPTAPPEASFALVIDFEKCAPNPGRVFQAADAMIRALEQLDRTLCAAADSHITPIMLLEDIEAGSIKAWLGNQLNRIEDEALKTLDWKPLIGRYLVRAKYAVIRWSNKDGGDGSLIGLARELQTIGQEADIRHLPDYQPPSLQDLSQAAKRIDEAKGILGPNDKMHLDSADEGTVEFNLSVRWTPEELDDLAVKETTKFENMPMTLIVKRPDYLGKSKWDFRFGKKPISARIDDTEWLKAFQDRQKDVRPGDALRCLVTIEHKYGYDNELIVEDHIITKVAVLCSTRHHRQTTYDSAQGPHTTPRGAQPRTGGR